LSLTAMLKDLKGKMNQKINEYAKSLIFGFSLIIIPFFVF
jgi:hypothetical protein